MKEKPDEFTVIEDEPTRSILNIMFEFEEKDWFRPMHFLYALMEEYSTEKPSNDPEAEHNIRMMQDFYKDRLELLIKRKRIKKGCIKSPQQLSYHLGVLYKLEAVDKKGRGKKTKYKLNKDFYRTLFRVENQTALDLFPSNQINDYASEANKIERIRHIIYGLKMEEYNRLKEDDRQTIKDCLEKIEVKIQEIERIKQKIVNWDLDEIRNSLLNKTKSSGIKKLLTNRYGGLLGIIYSLIDSNYELRNTILEDIIEHNIKSGLGFLSWAREYNLSENDIDEICVWAIKNHEYFCNLCPLTIAFSRYREYEPNPLI